MTLAKTGLQDLIRPWRGRFGNHRLFAIVGTAVALLNLGLAARGAFGESPTKISSDVLRIVVMDPTAGPLSCACVDGRGQRRYDLLASALKQQLNCRVDVIYEEGLNLALDRTSGKADVVIGVKSVVEHDIKRLEKSAADRTSPNSTVAPLVLLGKISNRNGTTSSRGVFLTQAKSKIKSLHDLKGKAVILAPAEYDAAHQAARDTLIVKQAPPAKWQTADSLDNAVFALADGDVDAAICPDYMAPMLEACGKIEKDALRVIGSTMPVAFVEAYATSQLPPDDAQLVSKALHAALQEQKLADAMETAGFVRPADVWHDWRGVNRKGHAHLPSQTIHAKPREVWTVATTGPAMAGIAANRRVVLVPDKDKEQRRDVFRCFDAAKGAVRWTLAIEAPGAIDYTNSPRATPVVRDGLAYLLGAWGDLRCVEIETGAPVWKMNMLKTFQAEPLNWGCTATPLLVNEKLIVNPGGEHASLVALNARTGNTIWKSPGHAAAYGAMIAHGSQAIGYDAAGLAAWSLATGKRQWALVPPGATDFNVGTPLLMRDGLLLATENNGCRFYAFNQRNRIEKTKPTRENQELAPDTCSPVLLNGRVYCTAYGELFCLDAKTLRTLWVDANDRYYDHTNLIACGDSVLVWTTTGELLCLEDRSDKFQSRWSLKPFGDDVESMSHPAVVGRRIYLRTASELKCLEWPTPQSKLDK